MFIGIALSPTYTPMQAARDGSEIPDNAVYDDTELVMDDDEIVVDG